MGCDLYREISGQLFVVFPMTLSPHYPMTHPLADSPIRKPGSGRFPIRGSATWIAAWLRWGVAAAAALGLAALGAVLFLDADEAQPATMLANDAGALNALVETAEELIEALAFTEFCPHAFLLTSPQGRYPGGPVVCQDEGIFSRGAHPCAATGIVPASRRHRIPHVGGSAK